MINRDVAFWDSIASHPEVSPYVFMGEAPSSLRAVIEDERVLPLASENGGAIFIPVGPLGMVHEMHTMFRPGGWGREVARSMNAFMRRAFLDASLVVTHEQEGYWKSSPPKSHGWKVCGDFRDVGYNTRLRLWSLTREQFASSAIGRKQCP